MKNPKTSHLSLRQSKNVYYYFYLIEPLYIVPNNSSIQKDIFARALTQNIHLCFHKKSYTYRKEYVLKGPTI